MSALERGVTWGGAASPALKDGGCGQVSCRDTTNPIETTTARAAAPAINCGTEKLKLSVLKPANHLSGRDQKLGCSSARSELIRGHKAVDGDCVGSCWLKCTIWSKSSRTARHGSQSPR